MAAEEITFGITDVELRLDYHAASIGADLGDQVLVTEVELAPVSSTHRVTEETLQLMVGSFNQKNAWQELTDYRFEIDEDGTIRYVLREPVEAKYVKIHSHWNELDGEGDPINLATFFNAKDDILTVTYLVESRQENYSYDAKGNRLAETIATPLTNDNRIYSYYPNSDRLKSDERYGYRYDANGNLIEKGSVFTDLGDDISVDNTQGDYWLYDYDLLNRLASVSTLDEGSIRQVAAFTYDHRGYRVRRVGDDRPADSEDPAETITTVYIFDTAGRVVEEIKDGATVGYVYVFGKHLAKVADAGTAEEMSFYYLADHLGSTVGVTDTGGVMLWQDESVPFGESAGKTGLLVESLKYTGKDVDPATGLYYFNARWYDAATGRFATEDPIRDGLNWYQYARSNPLRWVDPSGLEALDNEDFIDALTIDNQLYLDYWIDRFDSGNKEAYEAAVADLKASEETFSAKFGSADEFYDALAGRFEQKIEGALLAEADKQGVPMRYAAAVYLTEVGDGGGQYHWPSGDVVVGPPDGRGIFQIEPTWWSHLGTEEFTYSWNANIKAGITIVKDSYQQASARWSDKPNVAGKIWADPGETKGEVIARTAYAIYNAGGDDWSRPWNLVDHRDLNFQRHYQGVIITGGNP